MNKKIKISDLLETTNVKLSSLLENDRNPRVLKEKGWSQLERSIKKNGLVPNTIIVDVDNKIISGNQRARVAYSVYGDIDVYVLKAKQRLTKEQFDNLMIVMNVSSGEWDTDILSADFSTEELFDFGLEFDFTYAENKQKAYEEKYYNEDGTVKNEAIKKETYNKCPECKYEW